MGTQERKKEHLNLFKMFDLSVADKTNGFEKWDWIPAETAEINYYTIDTSTSFLGYFLSFPFMIAAISGGDEEGDHLNEHLAACAEAEKIPLGIGSMRSYLGNKKGIETLKHLRDLAPHVPLISNIGVAQIIENHFQDLIISLTLDGQFDAIAVHFNKIQEMIQPEGDKNFTGILDALSHFVEKSEVPIIVKQVGHGFSQRDIENLWKVGIRFLDVGGRGGTSWSRAERLRRGGTEEIDPLDGWGISTADCLIHTLEFFPGMYCIAGGGINTGHDLAKAIALGAHLGSSARIIYQAYVKRGVAGIQQVIKNFREVLRQLMFLTGCPTLLAFRNNSSIMRRVYDGF
ncbi:MAG: type 2 isopentenyl-diphosphate Delta-isomerase [Candidatus Marinimicrobia bacterium]|nr:type 2 isopentenyl-diphosphate Delta-isomerase [Candidatus Neomarinimicrobiota bacterium]MDD5582638.1 type 2 isopentenyl-diphosphate Delta-isomerase [Candidatus Neomarinimicrobiota bacterium]